MIARGSFEVDAFGRSERLQSDDLEREHRVFARDRDRARCEDLMPRCTSCRGRRGGYEMDPDGRYTNSWAICEACEGTGVGDPPPPPPAFELAVMPTTTTTVVDFGEDEVPF